VKDHDNTPHPDYTNSADDYKGDDDAEREVHESRVIGPLPLALDKRRAER